MGLNIVGKLDLSQFDRRPKAEKSVASKKTGFNEYQESLDRQLDKMAGQINDQYGYFVDKTANISLDSYPADFYDRAKADKYVDDLKNIFVEKSGQSREVWEKEQEKKDGIVTEKVLVLLFHKIMGARGDGFLTVRSSTFDDYHGVDTVIIDEESGNAICGFDEMSANENTSLAEKGDKISRKVISRNGAYIQYGATIKDQKLEKKSLKNVPAFYLALSHKDLEEVLPNLEGKDVGPVELKTFQKLITSLEQQLANLYWEFDDVDIAVLHQKQEDLKKEKEIIKKNNPDIPFFEMEAGRNWRKAQGENNFRINILNFKKSLVKMKKMAGLE
ncbi:hypothetical protein COT98_00990 [Candidatus Falkowbacteria bacterium CG10_big_fil_rev_8_21_14_0_10_39_9]|uniref:Uncharacterized protein n=1 Tax=Candidatus Falkowbacteria bacterium CG10_big_fil_rev_8_21_14_0_10_39_9 TaxID=1974566 RepID=A0A2M6WQT1_9BACT|nr:MAG: hypothetical protein COT98_00990 [Candidatus Falkowbacteria bacterium CG10_big_fil_rev_8_21_14_0_10_39_9]